MTEPTDLATAIEAEAARRAEVAAAAPAVEPITTTIPLGRLPLSTAYTMWRAWWEDRDMWDGAACYVDRDTALTHAAIDYVGEEYGWPYPEDEEDEQPTPGVLVWTWEHGAWHLSDGGRATLVQVYEERVYGPAAPTPGRRVMAEPTARDADLLPDLRRFVAEHPQTCNAHIDALLRRAVAELEHHQTAPAERNHQ